jgi:hypothetical protein
MQGDNNPQHSLAQGCAGCNIAGLPHSRFSWYCLGLTSIYTFEDYWLVSRLHIILQLTCPRPVIDDQPIVNPAARSRTGLS